ncbi:hypothetical protein [Methanosarcina sp.]|uniref:hypothetical protein n=1 Tax=Methanosarcina sp. TaxID=2213 RepID=UPI003BB61BF9
MSEERILQKYAVGEMYPGTIARLAPGAEGLLFDFSDTGAMIIAAYKNPTDREIWNFGSKPIKFGLLEMQGIIFILAKVGTEAWVDLPYFVDLMPHFETSDIPDMVGYLVQVVLIDADSFIIKAMRLTSMPTAMSRRFNELVEKQRGTMPEDFQGVVDQVYKDFTTEHLVALGEIFYDD